jgi:membrane protein YdbS with pleckstrin-like domain
MQTESGTSTLRAQFNPLIRPYLMLYVAFFMSLTVVLIPLLVVWFLGVGQWWSRHYFEKLTCDLTDSVLHFTKGIIVTVEKTVPLENIQDVTFIEGPLLRKFNLAILKIETAGQSEGQAHAMELIGIIDAQAYRKEILARRQAARNRSLTPQPSHAEGVNADAQLEALRGIQSRLDTIVELLREQKPS